MKTSPTKTKRSSTSSRPTPPKQPSPSGIIQHPLALAALIAVNLLLLILALYLLQEGLAQKATPGLRFFVDFPTELLPLAYAAALLLLPNLALSFFVVLRGLPKRRWPWVTTVLAAILLGVIVVNLGLDAVLTIISPESAR